MDEPGSHLCMSCGLCCNGSIYDHASLTQTEAAELSATGATIAGEAEEPFLRQPCQFLCETLCTIYESRPGTCRKFRCEVLKQLEAGDIDEHEARDKVATAKKLAASLSPYLAPGETISNARRAWRAWNDDPDLPFGIHLPPDHIPRFRLAILLYNRYVDLNFRGPQQAITFDLGAASQAAPPTF